MRTDVVRSLGGFDPTSNQYADWDLNLRLALCEPPTIAAGAILAKVHHTARMTSRIDELVSELELVHDKWAAERARHGVSGHQRGARWIASQACQSGPAAIPMLVRLDAPVRWKAEWTIRSFVDPIAGQRRARYWLRTSPNARARVRAAVDAIRSALDNPVDGHDADYQRLRASAGTRRIIGIDASIPVASVVVPSLNGRGRVVPTIRSILAQDCGPLDVIVVDDGSAISYCVDELSAATGPPRHPDSRLRVVRHEERRGLARARNSGVEVAESHWIAFCDDDDLWLPDKLRRQLAAADVLGAGVVGLHRDRGVFRLPCIFRRRVASVGR